ncbi:MAG: methyltransferase domain-containing protein [Limisphaerales bacterium]
MKIFGKNLFRWVANTWRRGGLLRVIRVGWTTFWDGLWDWRHGTETLTRIPPDQLQTDSDNKQWAQYYGATKAGPLMKLFRRLGLGKDNTFVDLGCGKGRVVMLAAQHGFKRVVGVDFSSELCGVAERNIAEFRKRRAVDADIRILHSDVVEYAVGSNDSVFFLYDPFSKEVLSKVLENIRLSLIAEPRNLCLIYNSPRHHEEIHRSGVFERSSFYEIGGNEFYVYHVGEG